MSNLVVEKVLSCHTLPSLPGVAMRVLELTQDKNVAAVEIASTIQKDPALTTKVLRTVNSSYYALSTPCPSIKRATGLLGINTVKSIVLGFSLVESAKKAGIERQFDMMAYWRRAIYSAAGAKIIAALTGSCDAEEAFVGALVQDIGVLAFACTLKGEYDQLLQAAGPDHGHHIEHERKAYDCDHSEVGALLAERWRLPPQLIECIKRHHDADNCHPSYEKLVRVVVAGGMAAAALTHTEDKSKLGMFVTSMRKWFSQELAQSREVLVYINEAAKQLGDSLELRTGQSVDIQQIMSEAQEQLIQTQEAIAREALELKRNNDELERKNITDTLTGAFNRAYFDRTIAEAFANSNQSKMPVSVLFSDADRFKSVNDTHGHQAGDGVLVALSARFRETIGNVGTVCRYGGEEFAIIVPGANSDRAMKLAELLRKKIAATQLDVTEQAGKPLQLPVTVSIGVATHVPGTPEAFDSAQALVHAADVGVYAAKQSGRNCVRLGDTNAPAPVETTWRVMVIEDDALAARLIGFLFEKRREFSLKFCTTGEEALQAIEQSTPEVQPQLVLSDLQLPGVSGIEVISKIKTSPKTSHITCAVLSSTKDESMTAKAAAVGAVCFIEKTDFCAGFDGWLTKLTGLMTGSKSGEKGKQAAA